MDVQPTPRSRETLRTQILRGRFSDSQMARFGNAVITAAQVGHGKADQESGISLLRRVLS